MAEPFFGSVSQLWPAMPGPAFGYIQTGAGTGPIGPGLQGLTAQGTTPFGGGMQARNPMTGDPFTPGAGTMGAGLQGMMPGLTGFGGPEIGVGITATTLLTAVAIRRGQPQGPANDQEIEDFIYDALDLLPSAADVEIRCENGKAIITGTVPHKRLKRDVGEIAWAIPSVNDVQNNITIAQRRRSRQGRENEPPTVAARKQA